MGLELFEAADSVHHGQLCVCVCVSEGVKLELTAVNVDRSKQQEMRRQSQIKQPAIYITGVVNVCVYVRVCVAFLHFPKQRVRLRLYP